MIRFGTGGWRAVMGDDFTKYNVKKVATALCALIAEEGKAERPVVVGYDRRFLSAPAAGWFSDVLNSYGIDVIAMNRSVPTPLVMVLVKDMKLHFGIEITASHNPSEYDGIKVIVDEGRDAPVEVTDRLEALIEAGTLPPPAVKPGSLNRLKTPFNGFLDSILGKLDLQAIRDAGIRILVDSMHGSATFPLITVL
ncbi:MAG: phosphoglucomutase/phosphomannomutase family protein, partial [Clostridia bacterium]|nr:phosphoglucomutase/phosphomannomutase family protein [Clostridia bacterium]